MPNQSFQLRLNEKASPAWLGLFMNGTPERIDSGPPGFTLRATLRVVPIGVLPMGRTEEV